MGFTFAALRAGKKLAENARRKVTANFLIDAMVAKYLSVYDRSLGQASQ